QGRHQVPAHRDRSSAMHRVRGAAQVIGLAKLKGFARLHKHRGCKRALEDQKLRADPKRASHGMEIYPNVSRPKVRLALILSRIHRKIVSEIHKLPTAA